LDANVPSQNHVARLKLSRAHGFERTDDEDGN
jgi:hypothetical protein